MRLISLVDRVRTNRFAGDWHMELDELVYALFEVKEWEREAVGDTLEYGVEQYAQPGHSSAYDPPDDSQLAAYADRLIDVLNRLAGTSTQHFEATYQSPHAPFIGVTARLMDGPQRGIASRRGGEIPPELLRRASAIGADEQPGVYRRPNVKLFDSDSVTVVKPNERRFWTRTVARSDADAVISQLVKQSPSRIEVPTA